MNRNHLKKLIRTIGAFVIVFLSVGPILAQDNALDGYDEASSEPAYFWNITIDSQGEVKTGLMFHAYKRIPPPKERKDEFLSDLEEVLQCKLKDVDFHAHKHGFTLRAECRIPLQERDLAVRGFIKPQLLWERLQKAQPGKLRISLSIPRLGYAEVSGGGRAHSRYSSELHYSIKVEPDQQVVNDLSFEFGYHTSDVAWMLVSLMVVLIAPLVLILRVRKRSLSLAEKDPTAAWFGYWRVHLWILGGATFAWAFAMTALRIDTFVAFAAGIGDFGLYALMLFIPPMVLTLLWQYLSLPVWLRVRKVALNRREMLVRGFWANVVVIVPLALVVAGITTLVHDPGKAMLCFAGALVVRFVGTWFYGKISGTTPRVLFSGEFKERVLEHAQLAGVKLSEVLIMPAQQLQMGNAFAVVGSKVLITDYLLEKLTKKEADCVMAHEIGHVKSNHALILSWASFLLVCAGMSMAIIYGMRILPWLISSLVSVDATTLRAAEEWIDAYLSYPVPLVLFLLSWLYISRKFERRADEFATLLTGDPESMITALVKLTRMNLMPIQWGFWEESLITHPSTMKRLEAIAQRHRIPRARLLELLDTPPDRDQAEGYEIPHETAQTDLIFSTEFKKQKVLVIWLITMVTIAAAPLLAGCLIRRAGLSSWLFAVGLVLMPMLYLAVANYLNLLGYRNLERRLRERLESEGVDLTAQQLHFVGISPEAYPRVYDNHTVWDVGFLAIEEGALSYCGEKIRFGLQRESIGSIAKGRSYPDWFKVPEILVTWRNGDKEQVFRLHSLDGRSMMTIAKSSNALLTSLMEWHEGKTIDARSAVSNPPLVMPDFPDVKGLHPRQAVSAAGFVISLMFIAFLVYGISWVVPPGRFVPPFALGTGIWTLIFACIPSWRYKEQPAAYEEDASLST